MIEDDIYRSSSQYRLWSYTEASLQSLRATTNAVASERVRVALRRSRETHQSAASSAPGTPQPGSDVDGRNQDDKEIDCLTPEEELVLVRYYCEKTLELGETYKPPMPTMVRVRWTAGSFISLSHGLSDFKTDIFALCAYRPLQSNTSAVST